MSLNAANIRCSDLEWQLEDVRARLLTSSQDGDRLQMQCATLEHRLQEQQLAFSLDKGIAEQRVADLEMQLEDVEGQLQEVCNSSALAKQEKEELKMKVLKIEEELAGAVFVHGIVEEQVSVVCPCLPKDPTWHYSFLGSSIPYMLPFLQSDYRCKCEHRVPNANTVSALYVKGTEHA
jgi:hypothetical protein